MNDSTPKRQNASQETPGTDVAIIEDRELLAKFAEMAAMIPAESGNANESILRQILTATSWKQLDAPWDTADLHDVLDRPMMLNRALRRPSTYAGGLGMYLVLFLTDIETGEERVKATGAVAIVGEVVRAYAMSWMPLKVVWRQADRPTDDGYYPQHLDILDGPAAQASGRTTRTATQV